MFVYHVTRNCKTVNLLRHRVDFVFASGSTYHFRASCREADGDGSIDAEKLIQVIKHEFQMPIDIEALIEEIDEDGSGEIEFDEFKALLESGQGAGDDPTEQQSEAE